MKVQSSNHWAARGSLDQILVRLDGKEKGPWEAVVFADFQLFDFFKTMVNQLGVNTTHIHLSQFLDSK